MNPKAIAALGTTIHLFWANAASSDRAKKFCRASDLL